MKFRVNFISRLKKFCDYVMDMKVGNLMEDYTKESTIHGIKYLGEKKHWSSKIFWLAIFIISLILCINNIMEIYRTRQERPVMISFAKKLTPTFEIPFAAVTICPEAKARCDKINVTEMIDRENLNYTIDEMRRLTALSHVCDKNIFNKKISKISEINDENFNVINTLDELSYSFKEIFDKCRYGSWKYEKCEKLFYKIYTDAGICYTFNMLDYNDYINNETMHTELHYPSHGKKSNWFLEKDYDSMKVKVYPRRIFGSGLQSGLSVQLKFNSSMLCSNCLSGVSGFRVSLHMNVEKPSVSKQFYNVPFNRETNLIVKPNMIYASKDIKDYDPDSRQCYFSYERKLKYHKIYSRANCNSECKADYINNQCGCVKFHMPRSNETSVCNSTKLECVYEAEMNFTIRDLERKLMEKALKRDVKHGKAKKNDERFKEIKKMNSCNCLSSCTHIKYDVEVSQTDYNSIGDDGYLVASINVYFKDSSFTRLKRYEIYGWSDFLSNSGGTLGLFLGCSVLSFIEIIYHIIVYFIKRVHRKISPEIIAN